MPRCSHLHVRCTLCTMAVSKGIVDAHGGTLSVHSEGEGHGCTFTLELCLIDSTLNVDDVTGERFDVGNSNAANRYRVLPTQMKSTITPQEPRLASSASQASQATQASQSSQSKQPTVVKLSSVKQLRVRSSIHMDSGSENVESVSAHSISDMRHQSRVVPVCEEGRVEEKHTKDLLPKILVVDDAPLNRTMLIRLLRTRCSSSAEAEDGCVAVEMIRQSMAQNAQFDIVLMDYCMPEMDGPSATRIIRDMGFKGLILGVTGNALPEDVADFMASGANAVLVKPLNVNHYDLITSNYRLG